MEVQVLKAGRQHGDNTLGRGRHGTKDVRETYGFPRVLWESQNPAQCTWVALLT
jgi:hypothetical protein